MVRYVFEQVGVTSDYLLIDTSITIGDSVLCMVRGYDEVKLLVSLLNEYDEELHRKDFIINMLGYV